MLTLLELVKYPGLKKQYRNTKALWDAEPASVQNVQFTKLKSLCSYAVRKVPYYRNLGISSSTIASVDSAESLLSLFPFLTRSLVVEKLDEMISDDFHISRLEKGSSSGSTGNPIVFYKDANANSAAKAAQLFGWETGGYLFGSKRVSVWGNRKTVEHIWPKFSSRLKAKVLRETRIAACNLTNDKAVGEAIRKVRKTKPAFLEGYTNALHLLAQEWLNRSYDHLDCTAVFTTAESLFDYQRTTIEAAFGPVFDQYGSSEVNSIAFQCPYCAKYHVILPHVFTEYMPTIIRDQYRIIVSDLDNFAMPLIRYEIGDLVSMTGSYCSKTHWPVIDSISGRESDIIRLEDGTIVNPISIFGDTLGRALRDFFGSVVKHRTIWDGRVFAVYISLRGETLFDESRLKSHLAKVWHSNTLPIAIKPRAAIEPELSGKSRFFINQSKNELSSDKV